MEHSVEPDEKMLVSLSCLLCVRIHLSPTLTSTMTLVALELRRAERNESLQGAEAS